MSDLEQVRNELEQARTEFQEIQQVRKARQNERLDGALGRVTFLVAMLAAAGLWPHRLLYALVLVGAVVEWLLGLAGIVRRRTLSR